MRKIGAGKRECHTSKVETPMERLSISGIDDPDVLTSPQPLTPNGRPSPATHRGALFFYGPIYSQGTSAPSYHCSCVVAVAGPFQTQPPRPGPAHWLLRLRGFGYISAELFVVREVSYAQLARADNQHRRRRTRPRDYQTSARHRVRRRHQLLLPDNVAG